jgi:hypothetical protein
MTKLFANVLAIHWLKTGMAKQAVLGSLTRAVFASALVRLVEEYLKSGWFGFHWKLPLHHFVQVLGCVSISLHASPM